VLATDLEDLSPDLSIIFHSDADGQLGVVTPEANGNTELSASGLSIASHLITVTATDTAGLTTSITESVTVIDHEAPTITSVSILPNPAYNGDSLSCSYVFSDPDGDSDQSTIDWYLEGVYIQSGPNLNSAVHKSERWTCQVTPDDGWLQGSAVSADIVISNTAPICSGITLSPTPAYAKSAFDCSYTFTDGDGDSDTTIIEWFLDGLLVATGATLTIKPQRDQELQCQVTPFDGDDYGTECASSVLIQNSPGLLSGLVINPTTPTETDPLSCSWTFNDPDGDLDQSSQRWLVNGADPIPNYNQLASGYGHNCAIDSGGFIQCWGRNNHTELDGVPTDDGWVSIATGAESSCAVKGTGEIACWGNDSNGHVSAAPTDANYTSVALWYGTACALTMNGEISCWGSDASGKVSDAPTGQGYRHLSMTTYGGCAISELGIVDCWGDDSAAHVSDSPTERLLDISSSCCHTCGLTMAGEVRCWGYAGDHHESEAPASSVYQQIGVGTHYECGLLLSGEVECWGWAGSTSQYASQDQPEAGPFVDLAVGSQQSCALGSMGDITCWGDDTNGQVTAIPAASTPGPHLQSGYKTGALISCEVTSFDGLDTGKTDIVSVTIGASNHRPEVSNLSFTRNNPKPPDPLEITYDFIDMDGDPDLSWLRWTRNGVEVEPGYVKLDSAWGNTCAIDRAGSPLCWGSDYYGQQSQTISDTYTKLAVASHVCGLNTAGEVRCWGDDILGSVLDAPTNAGHIDLDVGPASCAVSGWGNITCWGSDAAGVVSQVPSAASFKEITVGSTFACALNKNGGVVCWGSDDYGYVSDAPTTPADSLASGCCSVCAVMSTGELNCWGNSGSNYPSGNTFSQVTSGTWHSCAIDTLGEISCWGSTASYTDANGTGPSGSGWRAITAGGTHTCAINSEGQLQCWGDDQLGEISDALPPTPIEDIYFDNFSSGDQVECLVLPYDGIEFGLPVDESVTF
jgi:alpha-tubulin suppressor-like RCC1 family protein